MGSAADGWGTAEVEALVVGMAVGEPLLQAMRAVAIDWRQQGNLEGSWNGKMVLMAAGSLDPLREARSRWPGAWLIALGGPEEAVAAVEAGADYVVDPLQASWMEATIRAARRQGRRREQALGQALELVADAVVFTDAQGRVQSTNAAFERLSGRPGAEVVGKGLAEVLESPLHGDPLARALREAQEGRSWQGSLVGLFKDGTAVEQVASVRPLLDAVDGHIGTLFVSQFLAPALHGTDENLERQPGTTGLAALTESERRLRTMMESAGDAILVFDFDSAHTIDVNPAACELFGYSRREFLALTGAALGGPEAAEAVARMSNSLKSKGFGHEPRHPMRKKDGSRFVADVRITSFLFHNRRQYLVIVRDVSDQVEREHALERTNKELVAAQDHLLHKDRLAVLGQLAASVAHEINNPLQFMAAGIERLRALPSGAVPGEVVESLATGLERVRNITASLRPFARGDAFQPHRHSLYTVVDSVRQMTANLVRYRATLLIDVEQDIYVVADPTRLSQLLTNLVTNAAQAIDEGRPGAHRIHIRSSVGARTVTLSVADTGRGMSPEVQARIFEPFFTTKSREMGTGLGLSLCLEIARQHGGDLRFESRKGEGTTFFFELPLAEPPAPTVAIVTPVVPRAPRRLRVLAVDDEVLIAECYQLFLPDMDFEVAIGGEEALNILASDQQFDAILCDLMMPRLDGPGLHEIVSKRWPGLEQRFVFCSGGAVTPRIREFLGGQRLRLVNKPVLPLELEAALVEAAGF